MQTRVGTRLRRLKAKDKTLGGNRKAQLKDQYIDSLQNSMGLAIRQNIGDLNSRKRNVGAILFHNSESNTLEGRHQF